MPAESEVIKAVCSFYGTSPGRLRERCKTKTRARHRMMAMYLLRQHTQMSLCEIARVFDRHHTTVVNAVQVIGQGVVKDYQTRREVAYLEHRLGVV